MRINPGYHEEAIVSVDSVVGSDTRDFPKLWFTGNEKTGLQLISNGLGKMRSGLLARYRSIQNSKIKQSCQRWLQQIRSLDCTDVATINFVHPYSVVHQIKVRKHQNSKASSLTINFLPFGCAVYASSCSIPSSSTMTVRKLVQITAAICFIW